MVPVCYPLGMPLDPNDIFLTGMLDRLDDAIGSISYCLEATSKPVNELMMAGIGLDDLRADY